MQKILKKNRMVLLALALGVFLSGYCSIRAEAHHSHSHSGRTETYYHCGGHPAHSHHDGVCPYGTADSSARAAADDDAETGVTDDTAASQTADPADDTASDPADNTAADLTDDTASNPADDTAAADGSAGIVLSDGTTVDLTEDMLRIVQDILNEKGYDCGAVDGAADSGTKEAITEFLEAAEDDSADHMIISLIAEALGLA